MMWYVEMCIDRIVYKMKYFQCFAHFRKSNTIFYFWHIVMTNDKQWQESNLQNMCLMRKISQCLGWQRLTITTHCLRYSYKDDYLKVRLLLRLYFYLCVHIIVTHSFAHHFNYWLDFSGKAIRNCRIQLKCIHTVKMKCNRQRNIDQCQDITESDSFVFKDNKYLFPVF